MAVRGVAKTPHCGTSARSSRRHSVSPAHGSISTLVTFDCFADTGEVSWLPNPLGLYFDEMEVTYSGGFDQVPDPVKFACAQLVRNAQAMPALNVREGTLNAMHFAYFADTLLDSTVRELLAPYVAQKVA